VRALVKEGFAGRQRGFLPAEKATLGMSSTQCWDAGVLRGELTAVQGSRYILSNPLYKRPMLSRSVRNMARLHGVC